MVWNCIYDDSRKLNRSGTAYTMTSGNLVWNCIYDDSRELVLELHIR